MGAQPFTAPKVRPRTMTRPGERPKRGLPIALISHNMPHVFEVADRIHIHRLGRRIAILDPKSYSMSDAVAIMTGVQEPPPPP